MIFGQKLGQNPYRSIVSAKVDDITVTSYFMLKFVKIEFLLIFMVRKIGQLLLSGRGGGGGGVVAIPQHPLFV